MRITRPARKAQFSIDHTPGWPKVEFETDGTGPHIWRWTLSWGHLTRAGRAETEGPVWDASDAIADLGGTLVVRARAGTVTASTSVTLIGENPGEGEVETYVKAQPDSDGFEKIVVHESKGRHFTKRGEPVKSFDNGYGLCQLTTPVPKYEEVWNWKRNIDAGLKLFAKKRAAALAYLSQDKRSYTSEQLRYETVCRWNGGSYHVWDAKAAAWVRKPDLMCDSKTGNIGWDMSDKANAGKTEVELHKRDAATYAAPPDDDAHWKYSGVCYADAILG
jgi:hypothetical protein